MNDKVSLFEARCHCFPSLLVTGAKEQEVQVSKEGKMVVEDYDPSKEYHFKISALSGAQESRPLEAKYPGESEEISV